MNIFHVFLLIYVNCGEYWNCADTEIYPWSQGGPEVFVRLASRWNSLMMMMMMKDQVQGEAANAKQWIMHCRWYSCNFLLSEHQSADVSWTWGPVGSDNKTISRWSAVAEKTRVALHHIGNVQVNNSSKCWPLTSSYITSSMYTVHVCSWSCLDVKFISFFFHST